MKTNGKLEVEFQNQQGRQLRVTENRNPAAAPKGFVALEPVSYIVELGGGAAAAQGLTLSKIDYIQNANSELRLLLVSTPSSFSIHLLRSLCYSILACPFLSHLTLLTATSPCSRPLVLFSLPSNFYPLPPIQLFDYSPFSPSP